MNARLTKNFISTLLTIGWLGAAAANLIGQAGPTERSRAKARYKVTLISSNPLKLSVEANIPINGDRLDMENSYPAELPEMSAKGWPALISNLVVKDAAGKNVATASAGDKGWRLLEPVRSQVNLSYDIDYSIFAAAGWSSPLESAFTDNDNAIVAGRSLFITTADTNDIDVEIVTPNGWAPVVPWALRKGDARHYRVESNRDLIDNVLAFSKNEIDSVTASGFKVQIVSMGHWRPLRPLLREVLKTIVSREVDLMRYDRKEIYTVVLLPIADEGGNAFRQSFVYTYKNPDPNNKSVWANTLAHEIFHYWNYSRLQGADYASSQWFQEGFTEYVANLVMVNGKITEPAAFLEKLGRHVNNYRRLTTTLENYGTHKGPPLYSAGALVAFMWDVEIRRASGGKRNIGDFFRNLMKQTDSGARKYTWTDIRAALQATADGDWEDFYQAHIRGGEPMPLERILPLVGLSLEKLVDGSERVGYDSSSTAEAQDLWKALIGK